MRSEMLYVITKLVANSKDNVQLIKMFNFKAIALFMRILLYRTEPLEFFS